MKFIKKLLDDEPLMYGGLFILIVGVWAFANIADEVVEGDSHDLDVKIIRALREPEPPHDPIGPKWMREMGRDVTALGGYAVLLLVLFAATGFLCLAGRVAMMGFMWAAVLSGYAIAMSLKAVFQRPRPDIVPHLSYVATSSFPSGHSMMSAIVYLTLGALLARVVDERRLKLYFLVAALVLSAMVGLSRVYMGVHYPSDVVAGWSAGLVWSTVCWITVKVLQQRGVVEKPSPSALPPP
jgi:undecaprenyl-diphosphatase